MTNNDNHCKRMRKHILTARRELRKAHAISKVHSKELDELAERQPLGNKSRMLGASKLFEKWTLDAALTTDSLNRTLKDLGC